METIKIGDPLKRISIRFTKKNGMEVKVTNGIVREISHYTNISERTILNISKMDSININKVGKILVDSGKATLLTKDCTNEELKIVTLKKALIKHIEGMLEAREKKADELRKRIKCLR